MNPVRSGLQLGIQRANGLFSDTVFEKMFYIREDEQIRSFLIAQVLDGTVGEMLEVFRTRRSPGL